MGVGDNGPKGNGAPRRMGVGDNGPKGNGAQKEAETGGELGLLRDLGSTGGYSGAKERWKKEVL